MEPIENDDKRSEIPFFNKKYSYNFFKIIDYLGLRPYVLNNLIYDKSKGNDFEKIEEILSKYIEKDQIRYSLSYFTGDSIILSFFNEKSAYMKNSLLNVDIDSEDYDKILEIDKRQSDTGSQPSQPASDKWK